MAPLEQPPSVQLVSAPSDLTHRLAEASEEQDSLLPGCGSSQPVPVNRIWTVPSSSIDDGVREISGSSAVEDAGGGMAWDPHKMLLRLLLLTASLPCRSTSEALVFFAFDVCVRRPERDFLLKPSFAPIFFQLLLWALIARCIVPGDVPAKAQSEVGGVVGGVIGSSDGGE